MYPGFTDPSPKPALRKMGFDKGNSRMDSRPGSVSSGLGSSSGTRGHVLKSSPFCPHSSNKMAQSLLKDHMVSHYKRIFSAKAAVDTSVPKSLIHSVKYNDQIRQKLLKKDGRPQSAHSVSERSNRTSCFTPQSRLSVQSEDRSYLSSRNSTMSSSAFGTSFHVKDVVYLPRKAGPQNLYNHGPSGSDRYQRRGSYKASHHPDQKTYSGDLFQKHSQHFTQDKPFTPKTLKSDKSSYLSKYRYYRAPLKKPSPGHTQSKVMKQEKEYGNTNGKKRTDKRLSPEPEWSDDEFSGTYIRQPSYQSRARKSNDRHLFNSPSRIFPHNGESNTLEHVFAEEEELMYLKLISAVTEDILSRGHITERILNLVMQRHIEMNRHHLDEDKMRHLMDLLRKEFQDSPDGLTCSADSDKKETALFEAFHAHLESRGKEPKEKDDLLFYSTFITSDSPDYTGRPFVSTPAHSPKNATSPNVINEDNREEDTLDLQLSEDIPSNTGTGELDSHQNETGASATDEIGGEDPDYGEEEFEQDEGAGCGDEESNELRGLEAQFSESLHVSSSTHDTAVTEQRPDSSSSNSEF